MTVLPNGDLICSVSAVQYYNGTASRMQLVSVLYIDELIARLSENLPYGIATIDEGDVQEILERVRERAKELDANKAKYDAVRQLEVSDPMNTTFLLWKRSEK